MKKLLAVVSLPLALVCMFACGKDKDTTPKPRQDSTKTSVDTINGEYFRFRYKDTTIVYRPQTQNISFLKLNSASYMYDLSGGQKVAQDTFDIDLLFGYNLPKDTGTYKIYGEFNLFESYSDSMYVRITKAAQIGQQMEATFRNVMQNNDGEPKDTTTIMGDFRLTVQEQ